MKRHAPSAARNRDPILEVLRKELPREGKVLEIASGSGEHAIYFAQALPALIWQPSDVDPDALASIEAHRASEGTDNLLAPSRISVTDEDWGSAAEGVTAVLCINMIHISPWSCSEGLVSGAARVLPPAGVLITYGPYRFDGSFTAPSNEQFDASLRARDPSWGVRDLSDVTRLADDAGLSRERVVAMPANNHTIVFRRR